jgi:hypothetical protein
MGRSEKWVGLGHGWVWDMSRPGFSTYNMELGDSLGSDMHVFIKY